MTTTTKILPFVYSHPSWIIPYEGNTIFDTIPNELLAQLFNYLKPSDLASFALACKDTHSLAAYTLDMVLCQVGFEGSLPLPLVMESKPLIDRIRRCYPDFEPPACDYIPYDDEYSSEEEDYYSPPPSSDSDEGYGYHGYDYDDDDYYGYDDDDDDYGYGTFGQHCYEEP